MSFDDRPKLYGENKLCMCNVHCAPPTPNIKIVNIIQFIKFMFG